MWALGSPPPRVRLRTRALRLTRTLHGEPGRASSALSPRCRWDACLLAAPLGVPGSSSPEGSQLFFLRFVVTSASIAFPLRTFISRTLEK